MKSLWEQYRLGCVYAKQVTAGAALCALIFPFCGESTFNVERELSESMDK